MNYVKALIRLIDQGVSTQVMLRDGSVIRGYWPHDIIARGNLAAGVIVVRGVVSEGSETFEERVIPLCDIGGVFAENLPSATRPEAGAMRPKPVPRGWTSVHHLA
jgi:hypothetical protein